ncbi:hypothetical protein GCM10009526_32230 [Glutamicibacter creatinolyticus]
MAATSSASSPGRRNHPTPAPRITLTDTDSHSNRELKPPPVADPASNPHTATTTTAGAIRAEDDIPTLTPRRPRRTAMGYPNAETNNST